MGANLQRGVHDGEAPTFRVQASARPLLVGQPLEEFAEARPQLAQFGECLAQVLAVVGPLNGQRFVVVGRQLGIVLFQHQHRAVVKEAVEIA